MTVGSGTRILLVAAVLIVCGAFLVSDGLFIIDELIYLIGAEAVSQGRVTVENGFETYGSEALRLWLLVEGPYGLVPQYPAGSSLLGAVLLPVAGVRGFILANAAAIAGTLFLIRGLARSLYGSEFTGIAAALLFAFGTYALEYAYGIWPHGIAVACATGALLLSVRALDAEPPYDVARAAAAGLVLGAGFLFRVDSILLLPGIGAAIILYGTRPVRLILAGVLGLLPAVAVAVGYNVVRFGSFNPLSYGSSGGGTDPTRHLGPLALMAALFVVLVLVRLKPSGRVWRPALLVAVPCIVAVSLAVPPLAELWQRLGKGAWALLVDMRAVSEVRPGVGAPGEATRLFWGLSKKALGQSLPWLGMLVALLACRWSARDRRGHAVLLCAAAGILPIFLMKSWHGGLGSNMRYFLPALPLLALVAARTWERLAEDARPSAPRLGLLAVLGAFSVVAWSAAMPSGAAGANQILPLIALAFVALAGATVYLSRVPGIRLLQGAVAVAVGVSVLLGPVADLRASQMRRAFAAETDAAIRDVAGPVLFIGPVEFAASLRARPDGLLAVPAFAETSLDRALIAAALDDGYRVFVADRDPARPDGDAPAYVLGERPVKLGPFRAWEALPNGARAPGGDV